VRLDHHSAVDKAAGRRRQRAPGAIGRVARETCHEASVIPPSSPRNAVLRSMLVMVPVVRGELHPIMTVVTKSTVTIQITFILQRVAGISTVS